MQKNSLQDILFCSTSCKSSAQVLCSVQFWVSARQAGVSLEERDFESMIYWERLKASGLFNLKTDQGDDNKHFREENNLFLLPVTDSTNKNNGKILLNLCIEKHWHRLPWEVRRSLSRWISSNQTSRRYKKASLRLGGQTRQLLKVPPNPVFL